jgi:hypothetical protein
MIFLPEIASRLLTELLVTKYYIWHPEGLWCPKKVYNIGIMEVTAMISGNFYDTSNVVYKERRGRSSRA